MREICSASSEFTTWKLLLIYMPICINASTCAALLLYSGHASASLPVYPLKFIDSLKCACLMRRFLVATSLIGAPAIVQVPRRVIGWISVGPRSQNKIHQTIPSTHSLRTKQSFRHRKKITRDMASSHRIINLPWKRKLKWIARRCNAVSHWRGRK